MGPWRHPKLEIIKKTADIDFFWQFDKRTMWKNIREPKKSADSHSKLDTIARLAMNKLYES